MIQRDNHSYGISHSFIDRLINDPSRPSKTAANVFAVNAMTGAANVLRPSRKSACGWRNNFIQALGIGVPFWAVKIVAAQGRKNGTIRDHFHEEWMEPLVLLGISWI